MRNILPGLFVVSLICIGLLVACGNPTTPCGTFSFTGSPSGSAGENIQTTFNFSPALCSRNCQTSEIAYIQIVRVIDRDTGDFLAPSTQQFDRIVTGSDPTSNGWSVDRIDGRVWGYYGRNNDGTFASYLIPGSSTAPSILQDGPGGWPDNTWFDAVDVPVCMDAQSSCVNNLLGYYYWLFIVDSSGNTAPPINEIGVDWMQTSVDRAVALWNTTAPGVGKNVFPPLPRL